MSHLVLISDALICRYSIQETSNEEFQEELDFTDDRTGKTYPAKWREHDHMHTVAGIIVALVRNFHAISSIHRIVDELVARSQKH